MKKKIIKRSAWLLAVVIAVSALAFGRDVAYGAVGIETAKKCSLTFALPENGKIEGSISTGGQNLTLDQVDEKYYQYYKTLNDLLESGKQLEISLYQVADVTVSGQYKLKSGFDVLGGKVSYKVLTKKDGISRIILPGDPDYEKAEAGQEQVVEGLTSIDAANENKAAQWEALARTAKARADDPDNGISPKTTKRISLDERTISGLDTGMYLICVNRVEDTEYFYDFVPFLISLPNNYYSLPGGDPISDDTWVYDVTVGLKPEQVPRYGTLMINKQLLTVNQLSGVVNRQGTFVFDVKAEKPGSLDFKGYNNVVSLYFNGTDGITNKFVTIGPDREKAAADPNYYFAEIPAGSQITVKETYSGAEYTAVGSDTQTIGFAEGSFFHADVENGENNQNQVTFQNAYDGRVNNGASVVNRYQQSGESGEWSPQGLEQPDNQ